MRIKALAGLLSVAVLHLVALGLISLSGGCRHPEVLQPRSNVPPPVLDDPAAGPVIVPETAPVAQPVPILKEEPAFKAELLKYTVKSGDSLWKIARMYGVSIGELAAENNIEPGKVLKVGMVLQVPPGGSLIPPEKLPPVKKAAPAKHSSSKGAAAKPAAAKKSHKAGKENLPADGVYVVKNGDSLWKIAVKFGLRSKDIADANKIDPSKALQVGQKLVLPGSSGSVKGSASTDKSEETLDLPEPTEPAGTEDQANLEDLLTNPSGAPSTAPGAAAPSAGSAPAPAGAPETKAPAGATTEMVEDTVTETTDVSVPAGDFISHETTEGETIESISALYGHDVNEILKLNPGMTKGGKIAPFTKVKIPRK